MRKTLGMGAALFALAIGAALLNRAKPGSQAPPSAASQGRPLRLDRLPVQAKPTPLPSTIAGRTKPATPTAPLQSLPSRAISAPALGSPSRPSTSANFEIGRDEVLKERDGVFGYNSRFYGATFDAGAVEIATGLILKDIGRPRFSYALEEVRVGGKSICSGGTIGAQADPETRTLSYARGSVEERYILSKESLEQTFVLRELPAGRGEITVTGRVATNLTPPRDGTSGGTLSFLYRDQELLSVAKAVAIDASGRRLPLELAYSGGRMSMSVPAEWVADAALPILVDPVIGGPVVVDNKLAGFVDTVNGQFVRICDAAYSGASGQWLAIWAEPFGASAFNYDLFGQRVDASGARVGKPLPIGTSTGGDYESSIAASSAGNFLVAWRHDPANDASDADQIILGRIVNADGTFAGGAFTLDDLPGQDFSPSLAFGGGQWLCAFTNIPSAGNSDIRGRLVSEAGVPGSAVELDLEADLAARPSLDFASTSFVVAWEKGPAGGPYSAVARAVDVAGALTTPITEVDAGTNDATFVDVSAGGSKVLIAWQERVSPSNMNVVGRIAEPSLAFATPPITLNAGLTEQVTPRAAYSELNSEWLVVYSDPITAGQDVYANRISIAGSAFPAEKVSTGGQADRRPELAWNSASNEMLIVYLFKTSDPYQVRARRFSMDYAAPAIPGTPVGAPNPNPTGTHTVSWTPSTDGGGSGLAGYDLQRSSDGGATYAIIASPTGTSFTELGLPLGSYLYRVRARDNAGNASAYSPPSDPVVVGGSAPLAPSNLAGSLQTPNSIQWTWVDASSDETGFRLKDENGVTRVDSIPVDATSILEAGLAPNTGYSRRAFAFSASGESAGSNLATGSTLLATPTQADFAVAATRWDQIQISVLPPPNSSDLQTGVRIERSLDGVAWELVQDFAPVYSALDAGRFQNTTHFYRITFQNRVGIPTASSPANTVSTPGMPAPVISSPADGALLSTQTPTVSGSSAIAGLTITLFVEGVPRGSTTSGTDGNWSLPPSSQVLDGQRSFTARASDALGNASAHSAAVLVTIDTNPPLITSASPANGSTTGSLRPTISAAWTDAVSGVAPATAQILLDGANITSQCTVTPTSFTHVPAVDLSQGGHTVAAQVADAAGNLGFIQWTFTVLPPDTAAPLLTLSPGQGEKVVDITPSFTATYSDAGAGIDLSQFRAFIDNVDVTASFSAGASQATFTAAAPLADGIHLFRASIKDLAGNLTELTNLFRVVSALAEVGTGGGSLAVTDPTRATFGARIDVPSGALSQPVTLWMEHVAAASPLPPGFIRVGPVVDFMPEMSFLQPVTVSLPYDEGAATALGVPEANLKLLRYDLASSQWVLLPVSAVQAAANLLQASLNSFAGVQIVAVAETSAQAYFVVEGPTSSIQAGTPVSITIRAFHPNGTVFDTFAGNVQAALTGGRGPAGNAVFPESIPATFTAADQGVLTLTDALTFALFGIQTVKVTADANPAMVGQTQVGVTPGPPTEFVKFAGDGQDALAGTVLAQALVTRVRDAYGNPIPGSQVSYLITSGGANFEDRPDNFVPGTPLPNPSTVTVDSLGYAISPYLRLPGSSTTTLVSATLLGSTLPSQDFLLFSSANQLDPPVITSPSSGSVVNTPTPVISGTIAIIDPEFPGAVPGYYVYLVVDGMPAGQTIIQTDLSWNILCNSLPNGTHNFFAYTYDQVSSRSSPGVSFSITVAGTDRPAITTPSQFVQTPTPIIEGTALPNTPVTVSFNGAVDGTTRSNGSGGWSYLATAKAPGVFSVVARAADSTGSLVDSNSVSIVYQANAVPQITTPSFTTTNVTPTIEGTAFPNVQVMISLSYPFLDGSTLSDASGRWTHTFSELAIGTLFDGTPGSTYDVVARMLLAGNQLSDPSNTITMTILGPDTTPPIISSIRPSNGSTTINLRPAISATVTDTGGSGINPASVTLTLDNSVIPSNQLQISQVNVNTATVSFTPASDLAIGTHSFSVNASDWANNAAPTIGSIFSVSILFPPPVDPPTPGPDPGVSLELDSVVTPQRHGSGQESAAPVGRWMMVKVRTLVGGAPREGIAVNPEIVSGGGYFFSFEPNDWISNDSGIATIGFRCPQQAGTTNIRISAKNLRTASPLEYQLQSYRSSIHVDLTSDFPGSGVRAYITIPEQAGPAVIRLAEVGSNGVEITDPALRKLKLYSTVYSTTPSGDVLVPLEILPATTGVAYLRAYLAEFEDDNGMTLFDTATINLDYYWTTPFLSRGEVLSGNGQVAWPNTALDEYIVIRPTIFRNDDPQATERYVSAKIMPPGDLLGSLEALTGTVVLNNPTNQQLIVRLSPGEESASFRYIAGPEGNTAVLRVDGYMAAPDAYPAVPLAGIMGDQIGIRAPDYRLVRGQGPTRKELESTPVLPMRRILDHPTNPIGEDLSFYIEAELPQAAAQQDQIVYAYATRLNGDVAPEPPAHVFERPFPEFRPVIKLLRQAGGKLYRSDKPVIATNQRVNRVVEAVPALPFYVIPVDAGIRLVRTLNPTGTVERTLLDLPAQIYAEVSPAPFSDPRFEYFGNGRTNVLLRNGVLDHERFKINLHLVPKPDRYAVGDYLSMRQDAPMLGSFRVDRKTLADLDGPGHDVLLREDGDDRCEFVLNAGGLAGSTYRDSDLDFTLMIGERLASRVTVPIRMVSFCKELPVQYFYFHTAEADGSVPNRSILEERVTERVREQHDRARIIMKQVGIMFRAWQDNPPILFQIGRDDQVEYNPDIQNSNQSFAALAAAASSEGTPVSAMIVDNILVVNAAIGLYVPPQPTGHRWFVLKKREALAMELDGKRLMFNNLTAGKVTAHEFGHAMELQHVAFTPVKNRRNLLWTSEAPNPFDPGKHPTASELSFQVTDFLGNVVNQIEVTRSSALLLGGP